MKELIYRELYLSKKGILLGSAIGLILFIGSTMVLLSARFGNLAKYNDPGELSELMSIIPTVTPAAIYCILLS